MKNFADAFLCLGLWMICAWSEYNHIEGLAILTGILAIVATLRNLP